MGNQRVTKGRPTGNQRVIEGYKLAIGGAIDLD